MEIRFRKTSSVVVLGEEDRHWTRSKARRIGAKRDERQRLTFGSVCLYAYSVAAAEGRRRASSGV